MGIRAILEYPDPRLEQPSTPVQSFDQDLVRLVGDLFDTLYAGQGIALSAPQISVHQRVLVADLSPERDQPQVFINPQVLDAKHYGLVEESCLSLPGLVGNVFRATQLQLQYQDVAGQTLATELQGMDAVCMQHEIDHLDGVLFLQRVSWLRRLRFRWTHKKRAA